jgi:pimeloyl-ACP methyl ester carboxylesterase
MHVTEKSGLFPKKVDKNKAPILVQPPMGGNPHAWLSAYLFNENLTNPVHLELRDAGHDLWFTYSRGTDYGNVHEEYAYDSEEFWDFTWEDMGVGDIKAALDYVTAETQQKVGLIGFSMGTTQIFSTMALDYEGYYKDRVYKVAQMAPCTVTDPAIYAGFNMITVNAINALNIFEIGGPNWYLTIVKLRKIFGVELLMGFLAFGWGSRLTNVST